MKIRKEVEEEQISRLNKLKQDRDNKILKIKLDKITEACKTEENLIPLIIDATQSNATLGEIVDSMKKVFGEWSETATI